MLRLVLRKFLVRPEQWKEKQIYTYCMTYKIFIAALSENLQFTINDLTYLLG